MGGGVIKLLEEVFSTAFKKACFFFGSFKKRLYDIKRDYLVLIEHENEILFGCFTKNHPMNEKTQRIFPLQ